ncbi:MAG: DUF3800 domain-containing protein [Armatimonadia bacterium]
MAEGQLVYLDESGDAGFKVGKGSSPTLVVAAVVLAGPQEAETTAQCIHRFRSEQLGKGRGFQFHFANLKREWRLGFLEAVQGCPFSVRAIVVQKDRIWEGTQLRRSGEHFYNFTVKQLLTHSFGTIEKAKLFVDGEAGRESLRRMVSYLRRECHRDGLEVFDEVRFVPKRQGNVLVQLADIVTSGIARSYRPDKKDCDLYLRALEPRLKDVWEFGRPRG